MVSTLKFEIQIQFIKIYFHILAQGHCWQSPFERCFIVFCLIIGRLRPKECWQKLLYLFNIWRSILCVQRESDCESCHATISNRYNLFTVFSLQLLGISFVAWYKYFLTSLFIKLVSSRLGHRQTQKKYEILHQLRRISLNSPLKENWNVLRKESDMIIVPRFYNHKIYNYRCFFGIFHKTKQKLENVTKKSSCVNTRGIPPAA